MVNEKDLKYSACKGLAFLSALKVKNIRLFVFASLSSPTDKKSIGELPTADTLKNVFDQSFQLGCATNFKLVISRPVFPNQGSVDHLGSMETLQGIHKIL